MYDCGLWRYIRFFENPVDFINSPVYRDGCEFSVIFPENPVGLAGMALSRKFGRIASAVVKMLVVSLSGRWRRREFLFEDNSYNTMLLHIQHCVLFAVMECTGM